ncbi:MAG TPA: MFS transporter [Trebonia sp.]|nr:MFS transporter [Trebonia sp.]
MSEISALDGRAQDRPGDRPVTGADEVVRTYSRLGRAFWRYWVASTVSRAGDAVTAVALPLIAVLSLRASSLEVSLITAASYAAWLIMGLPAGVLVQRLPLRGTQVAMDMTRALAVASIPVAALLGDLRLAQLVVVAFIVGIASVIFDVGNSTFLPSIVSKDELKSRNSLISASSAVTQLGGPSLGGGLVQAIGGPASLLVDVASYVLSAALLHGIPRPALSRRLAPGESLAGQIRDGWRFIVRHPVIRPCVAAATLVNFGAGAFIAVTPVFLVRKLGAPAALVGLLMAADGLGSLLGAMLTPWLSARAGDARAMLLGTSAGAVLAALIPLSFREWGLLLYVPGVTGFAMGVMVLSILTRTHRQTVTPPELLPRVMATVRFVSWGAVPAGAMAAGLTAEGLGPRAGLWLVCAAAAAAALSLAASPPLRQRNFDG